MNFSRFLGPALVASALAAQAAAVDPAGSFPLITTRYGIQVLAATPRQALQTAGLRTGFGLGLFAESETAPGIFVQTRLDFIRYPQANRPDPTVLPDYVRPDALTLAGNSLALGIDVRLRLHHPRLERLFLLAGVSATRFEFQSSSVVVVPGPGGRPVDQNVRSAETTPIKLGLAVGAGVDLGKDWVFTLRYTHLALEGGNFATLEPSLSYRF
jgi:hypothetical protein